MEKYIYRPVRFYLITFACTWFWWLFAILLNEGTGLYLGMFLGLVSPAVGAGVVQSQPPVPSGVPPAGGVSCKIVFLPH